MTPELVVLQPWKKLLEKNFFRKKNPSSLFLQMRPTKRCAEFFLKQMCLKIFNCPWFFGSEKLLFTIKLLLKLDRQKIKKIPHTILETIISKIILSNFCKIGLNPGELELLESALVINFSTKIVSEGFPSPFNFSGGLSYKFIVLISRLT